ncbi:hypothetical protein OEZ86_001578 [Tetradesmus obliquus]|nr:hypothetical protein OEZ86_001578 [Tetradesmus obliquus]
MSVLIPQQNDLWCCARAGPATDTPRSRASIRLTGANLELAAEAKSAQRMRAMNRRAMDEIRSVVDWVLERPLNSRPAGLTSSQDTPPS